MIPKCIGFATIVGLLISLIIYEYLVVSLLCQTIVRSDPYSFQVPLTLFESHDRCPMIVPFSFHCLLPSVMSSISRAMSKSILHKTHPTQCHGNEFAFPPVPLLSTFDSSLDKYVKLLVISSKHGLDFSTISI